MGRPYPAASIFLTIILVLTNHRSSLLVLSAGPDPIPLGTSPLGGLPACLWGECHDRAGADCAPETPAWPSGAPDCEMTKVNPLGHGQIRCLCHEGFGVAILGEHSTPIPLGVCGSERFGVGEANPRSAGDNMQNLSG